MRASRNSRFSFSYLRCLVSPHSFCGWLLGTRVVSLFPFIGVIKTVCVKSKMQFISPINIIFATSFVLFITKDVSIARSCDSNCFTLHHQRNDIRRRSGRFSFLSQQKRATLTANKSKKRYISLLLDCDYRRSSSESSYCGALASTLDETFDQSIVYHDVDQIKCREVHIDIDLIGDVTILEGNQIYLVKFILG